MCHASPRSVCYASQQTTLVSALNMGRMQPARMPNSAGVRSDSGQRAIGEDAMYEEFDGRTRTKIVRDADGIARVLSHADRHVAVKAATPQAEPLRPPVRIKATASEKPPPWHRAGSDRRRRRLSLFARKVPIRRDHR